MPTKVEHELTYYEIAHRLLLHQTPEAIAQATGLKLETVKGILQRDSFKAMFEQVRDKAYAPITKRIESDVRNVQDEIDKAAGESFDRLMELLRGGKNETVVKDVAQDLLNRAGVGRKQDRQPLVNVVITPIDAEVLATALAKEEEGKSLLRLNTLVKSPKELDHPAVRHGSSDPSSRPAGGVTSEDG